MTKVEASFVEHSKISKKGPRCTWQLLPGNRSEIIEGCCLVGVESVRRGYAQYKKFYYDELAKVHGQSKEQPGSHRLGRSIFHIIYNCISGYR